MEILSAAQRSSSDVGLCFKTDLIRTRKSNPGFQRPSIVYQVLLLKVRYFVDISPIKTQESFQLKVSLAGKAGGSAQVQGSHSKL